MAGRAREARRRGGHGDAAMTDPMQLLPRPASWRDAAAYVLVVLGVLMAMGLCAGAVVLLVYLAA